MCVCVGGGGGGGGGGKWGAGRITPYKTVTKIINFCEKDSFKSVSRSFFIIIFVVLTKKKIKKKIK